MRNIKNQIKTHAKLQEIKCIHIKTLENDIHPPEFYGKNIRILTKLYKASKYRSK